MSLGSIPSVREREQRMKERKTNVVYITMEVFQLPRTKLLTCKGINKQLERIAWCLFGKEKHCVRSSILAPRFSMNTENQDCVYDTEVELKLPTGLRGLTGMEWVRKKDEIQCRMY